jgi:hypothetical protein
MSIALSLPRELFQPAASPRPAAPPPRGSGHFASAADVAADLMQGMNAAEPTFVERRRKPRTGKAFHITR